MRFTYGVCLGFAVRPCGVCCGCAVRSTTRGGALHRWGLSQPCRVPSQGLLRPCHMPHHPRRCASPLGKPHLSGSRSRPRWDSTKTTKGHMRGFQPMRPMRPMRRMRPKYALGNLWSCFFPVGRKVAAKCQILTSPGGGNKPLYGCATAGDSAFFSGDIPVQDTTTNQLSVVHEQGMGAKIHVWASEPMLHALRTMPYKYNPRASSDGTLVLVPALSFKIHAT